MNKGNFTATDNFPVSTFTYDFLQQMSILAGKLAALGGLNYILSGCTKEGNNVNDGFIVINGEVLPFKGGVLKDKVTIKETKLTDSFAGVDYPESYILRNAEFSDMGEYNWDDFVQVVTNQELQKQINSVRGEPVGMKIDWSGRVDRVPENYVLADGRILRTADYPDLAWVYGKENEESFSVPDLRDRFIVGFNSTNPDYDSIGKKGGAEKLILTIDQMPNHAHGIKFTENKWGDNANSRPFPDATGSAGYTAQTEAVGGGEEIDIRPKYYVLAYIIKTKY